MQSRAVFATLAAAPLALFLLAGEPQRADAAPDEKGGRPTKGKVADGGKTYDPANVTALSEFMETCLEGNGKYISRDFPAAIEAYRRAVRLNPKNPLGHYLLAEAQLAAQNLAEAEASTKQAELNADLRDPMLRAKVLFVMADLKERQKKWEEARSAWQTYADWTGKYVDAGGAMSTAEARIKSVDETLKLDRAYAVVRERAAGDGGPGNNVDAGR
jgi:predicted Zn-dependent protease